MSSDLAKQVILTYLKNLKNPNYCTKMEERYNYFCQWACCELYNYVCEQSLIGYNPLISVEEFGAMMNTYSLLKGGGYSYQFSVAYDIVQDIQSILVNMAYDN